MDQIHIYNLGLDAPAHLARLRALLTAEERLRAGRFHTQELQDRFTVCRGALREILSVYLDAAPAAVRLRTGEFGKPYVPGSRVSFNVSHSADRALIAVTADRNVGVDIERVDENVPVTEIVDRYFSPKEVADLHALPADRQTEAFFRGWSSKEAYIKAVGRGLAIPLDSFDVSLSDAAALDRCESGYLIHTLDVGPGFAAAVVADAGPWRPVMLADPFEDAGSALPAAYAHGHHAITRAAALHFA